MSRKCDAWLSRIKAVERDYVATHLALEELLLAAQRNPAVLRGRVEVRHLDQALEGLQATYLIRLFAEFESGLREFWRASRRGRIPRTEHLLTGIAAARGVPDEDLLSAHAVRRHRNSLVHDQEEAAATIPLRTARGHLCRFFSRLPPTW